MVSSVFAPSRRRRAALWREFQRPLQREIRLVAVALHLAETAASDASPETISPKPEPSTHRSRRESHS
jgi:hypothetical protein